MKYENMDQLKQNTELQEVVKVAPAIDNPVTTEPAEVPDAFEEVKPAQQTVKKTKKKTPPKKEIVNAKAKKPARREPPLESDIGFIGRRPLNDPFRVGEKIVHEVTWLRMAAGKLTMQVKPFLEVNERKSYFFRIGIESSSIVSRFVVIDDYVDVLVDYEDLVPRLFTLHVRESSKILEAQQFMDVEKKMAKFWEKKVTEKHGKEERKIEWEVEPYAQDVYSAVNYMRVFNWTVGAENAFRVADQGENLVFRAKAIRKEVLSTDIGEFNTIVIKPEVELRGAAKPVGDIYIWLSDDERKYILRIEAEIKIGSLVSEVVEINPGQ